MSLFQIQSLRHRSRSALLLAVNSMRKVTISCNVSNKLTLGPQIETIRYYSPYISHSHNTVHYPPYSLTIFYSKQRFCYLNFKLSIIKLKIAWHGLTTFRNKGVYT